MSNRDNDMTPVVGQVEPSGFIKDPRACSASGFTPGELLRNLGALSRCFRCEDQVERFTAEGDANHSVLAQVWHGVGGSLPEAILVGGLLCRRCHDSWCDWRHNGGPRQGAERCADCGAWEHDGCIQVEPS